MEGKIKFIPKLAEERQKGYGGAIGHSFLQAIMLDLKNGNRRAITLFDRAAAVLKARIEKCADDEGLIMAKQQQQQTHRRKQLHSKKQIGARIQRRRIPTPRSYGREEVLTTNQQAWARAFTTSLSGWRTRQMFYKDHLEAGIQAEREAIATEAAYDAERLAQRKIDEQEEAKRKAKEKAEQEEEKAEAWAHKAWEMHKVGREVLKLKHEYYGWDPEEEEYPRDLKTERLLARVKSKRMAERRAELLAAGENPDDAYDTDKDSDRDNSDSEGSAGPGTGDLSPGSSRSPSGSPSPSPPQPAPVIERAPVVDWREKARAGVTKKKLSVVKAWGAITWNQKSNIQERLLVLEGDGYDITELLGGKASSERVTEIILARAAREEVPGSQAVQPLFQPGASSSSQWVSQESPPEWLKSEMVEQFLGPAAEDSPLGSPSGSPPHSPASTGRRSDEEPEDHTQPFSFDESYHPQSSRPLKRKRDDDDDADLEDELALSSPVLKKRKVQRGADDEYAAQALQDVKREVLCGVFRSARMLGQKPLPLARIVFFTKDTSVNPSGSGSRHPGLEYLYPRTSQRALVKPVQAVDGMSSASNPGKQDAEFPKRVSITLSSSISKCALDNIMAELRFLAGPSNGGDTIQIFDPDYDEGLNYVPTRLEERIEQNTRKMQRESSRIESTIDSEGRIVFRGDTIVLAELLKALRTRALLHHAEWKWDELRLRRSKDLCWYLSLQTQDTFVEIESVLERYSGKPGKDGVDIDVGVVEITQIDDA
ncbi:hypothetical protein E8E11_001000 [Didymella keratinophila]|nr:hypothetical protein E8E11_001000 [Didymella keratinophila]